MCTEYNISLIITVFNREKTLMRCMDSVLAQTFKGIEIIVVDDSSTDQSVAIVKKYVEKYDNIVLIECPENRGAGYAKNVGVRAAHGEYVAFVDSNDYIDPDYIENLYTALKKTGSELAVADISLEDGVSSKISPVSAVGNMVVTAKNLAQYPTDKPSIIPGIIISGSWCGASACTKLIKRESYLKFPFYEERRCDDLPALYPAIADAEQIVYVPQSVYHYCISGESSLERGEKTIQRQMLAVMAIAETLSRYRMQKVSVEYEKILVVNSLFNVLVDMITADDILESQEQVHRIYHLLHESIQKESLNDSSNEYLFELSEGFALPENKLAMKLIQILENGSEDEFVKTAIRWKQVEMDIHPKVSIVIPVYNGANYMREAIDSALNQTYSNIEVIVVNDGSRDDGATDKIARSYGSRIRYFKKANGGVATALNFGIGKMTGEYFSWLSHDDMYTPTKIEDEVRCLMLEDDRTAIVAEGYQVVDCTGTYLYTVNLHDQYPGDRLKSPMFLVMRGGVNGCALLIHKSHFDRVGLFDPALPTTQDYDLWFRMFRGQTVYYMGSSNVLSRSHEEQGSKALLADHVQECDKLWIGMMDKLTLEEKESMSGSNYAFYRETWEFLRTATGYQGAIQYAQDETYRSAIDEFERTNNSDILKTVCNFLEYSKSEFLNDILPLRKRKGQKPRIIFYLIDRYVLGGLNRIVLQVAGMLADQYDVIVTSVTKPNGTGYPTPKGVTELWLPWQPCELTANGEDKLSYLLWILRADVLVNSYNCVGSQLRIYEAAKRFGIHTIAWNHEFYFLPYWRSSLYECLICRNDSLRKADVAVWLNSFSAQAYRAFGENGIVLPNPNPFAGKKRTMNELPEDILALGRFDDARKGLEDLLRMFKKVLEHRPASKLLVVGPYDLDASIPSDSKKTYRRLIEELDLPKGSFTFEGEVSDVETYYQRACIHILPSKYEGFGLTILEAGTMGLPSVVYGGSGMDDIITDGVDGRIVPPGNWGALADAVLNLLDDPETRASMSTAAQEMAERYSPERITGMWCDVIDAILEKSHEERTEYLRAKYSYRPCDDPDIFAVQSAREYERCISSFLMPASGSAETMFRPVVAVSAEPLWQAECERMQQSFSWRITKPLRLIKKSLVCLKTEGLRVFLKKLRKKLLNQ